MTTTTVGIEIKPEVEESLNELPSATTPGERQLALYYAATLWNGRGDIFENGPLLGGATRALALGMGFNEEREGRALLHTYDWFSFRDDNPLDLWEGAFDDLVARDLLTRDDVDAATAKGSFLPLFKRLHQDHDYWPLVRPHVGYLPGHRDDVPPEGAGALFAPSTDQAFSIAFIDGCKSWYGTKFWATAMAPRLATDAHILFQDFGHHTCFWLPALVGLCRDRFELRAYVDHTYAWQLTGPLDPQEVADRFPDEPTGLGMEDYNRIFGGLINEAVARGDRYHVMVLQMQLAAAYAYIGHPEPARAILDGLLSQAEWIPFRPYLKSARVSPTYTPEGKVLL